MKKRIRKKIACLFRVVVYTRHDESDDDMKRFIGTHLEDDTLLKFGVRAAQQGKSKAELLRQLALQELERAKGEEQSALTPEPQPA